MLLVLATSGCSTLLGIQDLPGPQDAGATEAGPRPDGGATTEAADSGTSDAATTRDTGVTDSATSDTGADAGPPSLPTCMLDDIVKGILDECVLAP